MNYFNTKSPYILFQEAVNSPVYVDKSLLIEKVSRLLKTSNKYLCITRPRRFGKTMNVHMLGAYFTKGYDSHPLFENLAIARTESYLTHLNKHNVFYIDFSIIPDICDSWETYIASIRRKIREDLEQAYPALRKKEYDSISQMFQDTGESFLFLLDEWDSIFYRSFMTTAQKHDFLRFLKSLLKDRAYVELAYMTGVLPIAKYSSGSELNMFQEYNFMNDHKFEDSFGLNEEEVRCLCDIHHSVSFEELKYWYDGYRMQDGRSLFNPRSVNCALSDGVCLNYWTETGPMNEIADCIENNVEAVREDIVKLVAGIPVEVDLQGYSAAELQLSTRDEILSAMVVYGFLSYWDGKLSIPNHELMEKFQRVLSRDSMGGVRDIVLRSKAMLEATLRCDAETMASILETVHDAEIPFLNYGDENSLSCVVTLSYLYARNIYHIEREAKTGKGYCDYLFYPQKNGYPAIILELKAGKSCEEALAQIEEKNYIEKVSHFHEVLLVGINYDEKKRHSCIVKRYRPPEK